MNVARCEKRDTKGGGGCVNAVGHKGRCKVRPDAESVYLRAPDIRPLENPASPARKGRGAGKGGLLAEAQGVDAELRGLIGDLGDLDRAICTTRAALAKRFAELRKALVKSRREVLRLKNEWSEGGPAAADAANADIGAGDEEDDA